MRNRLFFCTRWLFPLLICSPVWAEGEGQADLDKAMELKLSAESMNDWGEVVNLCRSALASGLDDSNKEFATKMLVGTLVQRAEAMSGQIFNATEPSPQWPLLRRQALLDLQEASKLDDQQFDVQYLIGRLQLLPGGDRKEALAAVDAAIKLAGEAPHDQAKAYVLRANVSQDSADRLKDYDKAVELAPHDAEIIRTRGMFYLMEKEYDKALADLDKTLELQPEHADTHEARGVTLFLAGKNDEALKAFDRVIELEPKSALAHTHRARIFAIKNEPDKAMEDLKAALEINPKMVQALTLRARLHQQQGKKDEALEDVEEALQIAPTDPQALQLHALLLAGNGKFSDAITDLQQLRREEPDNVELLLQLGVFYSADKQLRKAIETFSMVLGKDANNVQALRSRGDAWLALGKLDEAIADYESALKVDPKESGVLNNLAWLLATAPDDKLRDGKRAIELAEEAGRVTEFKQAHILSTLAAAYAETGDFDTAKDWSQKAVALGEKDDKDILDQLRKELASYEAKQPWREKIESKEASPDPEPEAVPEPAGEPDDKDIGGQ
jgi:tetratricopeptide (TPR) repeat protein